MRNLLTGLALLAALLLCGACDVFVEDTPDAVVVEDQTPDVVIEDKTPDAPPPPDVDITIDNTDPAPPADPPAGGS